MEIRIVTAKIDIYLKKHLLENKWKKAVKLFELDIKYPSLETELLEPKEEMIYAFRIDKKYRAMFMIKNNMAYVFRVTNHYK